MTTVPKFEGKIRFHIKGAEALPAWTRKAIKAGLDSPSGPPEELRFQCRIAMDAREVFERIDLADGSTLRMSHAKTRPQFGKNRDGLAYLTTTLTHDATGDPLLGSAVARHARIEAAPYRGGRAAGTLLHGYRTRLPGHAKTPGKPGVSWWAILGSNQ